MGISNTWSLTEILKPLGTNTQGGCHAWHSDAVGEPPPLDMIVFLLTFSQSNSFKRAFETFQKSYQTSSEGRHTVMPIVKHLVYCVEADLSKTPADSCLFSCHCSPRAANKLWKEMIATGFWVHSNYEVNKEPRR